MSCGEKVGYYKDISPEELPEKFGSDATIRWLIKKEDEAPTFAMRVFTIYPGGHINPHDHPWEHEIFILSGNGRIRIGSNWYDVKKGFYIYVPPNVEHEYINNGSEPMEFICVIPHEPTAERKKIIC